MTTCQICTTRVSIYDKISLRQLLLMSNCLCIADEAGKKLNRGEKKCRKSLLKLGMKQLTGITRVTLKKRDGLIFVINDPEVLKSGSNENSYAIFGELKLEDPNTRLTQNAAKQFSE